MGMETAGISGTIEVAQNREIGAYPEPVRCKHNDASSDVTDVDGSLLRLEAENSGT
jgi:hypothetical protein